MKNKLMVLLVVLAVVVLGLLYLLLRPAAQPAGVKLAAGTSEAVSAPLPSVITLYQKGEGESDLAIFVSRELARELRGRAAFRLINVEDEPQLAEFYGVNEIPSVVVLTPGGAVQAKHEGYWEKASILAVLKKLGAN
jgi:thioredoxin 1